MIVGILDNVFDFSRSMAPESNSVNLTIYNRIQMKKEEGKGFNYLKFSPHCPSNLHELSVHLYGDNFGLSESNCVLVPSIYLIKAFPQDTIL